MTPNFLLIGAEKSGTTWLYDRLRRHPDVFMPEVKEIHYFNRLNSNLNPRGNYKKHDITWYRDHFRRKGNERAVGEATPMYLCDEAAPERIRRHLPDVKLIASLRYPTERAYSHYWMARGKEHTDLEFADVVSRRDDRFIRRGQYGRQLDRYLSLFGEDQLFVLIHEELFSKPSECLNAVCSFLEVDDGFYREQSWMTETVHQASKVRSTLLQETINTTTKWMRDHEGFRQILDMVKKIGVADRIKRANKATREYPEMPDHLRRELDAFYVSTVQRVEEILGRRIDVWRERAEMPVPEPGSDQ